MKTVIRVNNVQKSFKVYHDKGMSLKEKSLFWKRNEYENRQVLKGISFEVQKGEVLALIGKNGCGKSTTLKLLTRIMYPDSGTIEMRGRVASLIELGAGFHPDMSGRENIYINASIFGLTHKEINERLDKIIAFSELEEFIDNPVRTYSSGMYMRLAFSVAINVDADILLIDEILAVGDVNFQAKCFERLAELKAKGLTIVIVTHDLGVVERFCNKAVWIKNGLIEKSGLAHDVTTCYLNYMNTLKLRSLAEEENIDIKTTGAINNRKKDIVIEYVSIRDGKGEEKTRICAGQPMEVEIGYKINRKITEYVLEIGLFTLDGNEIYGNNTQLKGAADSFSRNDNGKVVFYVDSLPLLSGKYAVNISLVDISGNTIDCCRDRYYIDVVSKDKSRGVFSMRHHWEVY